MQKNLSHIPNNITFVSLLQKFKSLFPKVVPKVNVLTLQGFPQVFYFVTVFVVWNESDQIKRTKTPLRWPVMFTGTLITD